MKRSILAMAILFSVTGSASALAEEQAVSEKPSETVASETEASTTVGPGTPQMMPGKGMMRGGGQHGKGQGGKMHGGGQHGKGGNEKERQVVQRLDMIEARMAKIEAMLETLIRR
jgi:hypothetical protein